MQQAGSYLRKAAIAVLLAASPLCVRAAEPAPQPLDELDEVVVSGERIEDQILALETRFYRLYNELNKDDDYDMHCRLIPLEQGSIATMRACLPDFVTEAERDSMLWYQRCNAMPGSACYTPPEPRFLLYARKEAWFKNLLSVIESDPRLQQMNRERTELEMRLRRVYIADAQRKREEKDANGETRGQRLERLRCSRPTPVRTGSVRCTQG